MCKTYDKIKGGDTRELQSRMVPPKKLGRATLSRPHIKQTPCIQQSNSSKFVKTFLPMIEEKQTCTW